MPDAEPAADVRNAEAVPDVRCRIQRPARHAVTEHRVCLRMLTGTTSLVSVDPGDPGVLVTTQRSIRYVLAAGMTGVLLLSACGSSTPAASSSPAGTECDLPSSAAAESSGPSSAGLASVSVGTGTLPAVSMAAGNECGVPDGMPTVTGRTLTIATSEPAYEPWVVDNDPTTGTGFESAVAYAVATRLGYEPSQVTWTRVGFDEAIAKPDGFDFDINQFTITEDRKKQVDFSSGYYTVAQTVITVDGSPIAGANTVAGLKDAKLGAMNGTTSLEAISTVIAPTTPPQIFDDNSLAAQALQNGQIDGLVVDLPTAFYMTGGPTHRRQGYRPAEDGQRRRRATGPVAGQGLRAHSVRHRGRRLVARGRYFGRADRETAQRSRYRAGTELAATEPRTPTAGAS